MSGCRTRSETPSASSSLIVVVSVNGRRPASAFSSVEILILAWSASRCREIRRRAISSRISAATARLWASDSCEGSWFMTVVKTLMVPVRTNHHISAPRATRLCASRPFRAEQSRTRRSPHCTEQAQKRMREGVAAWEREAMTMAVWKVRRCRQQFVVGALQALFETSPQTSLRTRLPTSLHTWPATRLSYRLLMILTAIAAFFATAPRLYAGTTVNVARFVTPAEMRSGSLLLKSEGDRY